MRWQAAAVRRHELFKLTEYVMLADQSVILTLRRTRSATLRAPSCRLSATAPTGSSGRLDARQAAGAPVPKPSASVGWPLPSEPPSQNYSVSTSSTRPARSSASNCKACGTFRFEGAGCARVVLLSLRTQLQPAATHPGAGAPQPTHASCAGRSLGGRRWLAILPQLARCILRACTVLHAS